MILRLCMPLCGCYKVAHGLGHELLRLMSAAGVLPLPAGAAQAGHEAGQGSLASCYGDLYER